MDDGIIHWFLQIVSKEIKKKEFQDTILKPIVKSLVSYILPYLFFIVAINILIAVLAFIIVMYFIPRK